MLSLLQHMGAAARGSVLAATVLHPAVLECRSCCCAVQAVTALALLAAMRRPLPRKSVAPGWVCEPRMRRVSMAAVGRMLAYAGPICLVLLTKTGIYCAPSALCRHQKLLATLRGACAAVHLLKAGVQSSDNPGAGRLPAVTASNSSWVALMCHCVRLTFWPAAQPV